MKKQLMLGGFLAISSIVSAQWTPIGTSLYNTAFGDVAVGNVPSGTMKFEVFPTGYNNGIAVITPGGSGNHDAMLRLKNSATNGHDYWIGSVGNGHVPDIKGALHIWDASASKSRFTIIPQQGYVGFGTQQPSMKLHLVTDTTGDDGINIVQNGTGPCGVSLNATGSGRVNWSMKSGRASLPGHYFLRNETAGFDAMHVTNDGNFGIGTIAGINAKFAVSTSSSTDLRAAYFQRQANNALGIQVDATGTTNNSGVAMGISANAISALTNYGGIFRVYHSTSTSVTNYGVYGQVGNGPTSNGSKNYAVYGEVGGVTNGGLGNTWAGYFNGDVLTTSTSYYLSDKRLKKNIAKIDNSLSIISKLNPVNYNYDTDANPGISLPSQKQYGFLSQEVKEILPEFTKLTTHPATLNDKGEQISPEREILGLNYNGFIALLTKGIQEQQREIEGQKKSISDQQQTNQNLQKQIDELKALLNSLAGNPTKAGSSTGTPVQLSDKNVIVLDQNVPNPFAESTVISYNIPTDFTKAQIIFTKADGTVIKSVNITEKGKGTLNVFGNDLSHGMYSYTLVVDGNNVDTKKMVKE